MMIEKGAKDIISKDESLYIRLWRNYPVTVTTRIPLQVIPNIIQLKNNISNVYDPYISYHSESGLIHLNAKDSSGKKISFIRDNRSDNRISIKSANIAIPLCSVLFPQSMKSLEKLPPRPKGFNYNYYEISQNPKHPPINGLAKETFVVIDNNMIGDNYALSMEFFLHKAGGYLPKEEFDKKYQKSIIEMMRIDNNFASLAYVIVFRRVKINKTCTPLTITSVFSKDSAWIIGIE